MQIINAYADDDALHLVSRDEDGRRQIRNLKPEYSSFLRRRDLSPKIADEVRKAHLVKRVVEEKDHLRLVWRDKWSRMRACKPGGWFDQEGVEVFEADVDPVRRFLTDHPEVEIARPRRCYVDFEADSRKTADAMQEEARMLCWAVVDEEPPGKCDRVLEFDIPKRPKKVAAAAWDAGRTIWRIFGGKEESVFETERKVVRVAASSLLVEDSDAAEKLLIDAFWEAIEPYDQVVAWAGDFFDFPYLLARTKRARVKVDPRPWLWLDHLPWFRKMDTNSAESGDEKQSLKLDDVARSKCGVGKLDGVSGADSWDLWLTDPQRLLAYCERDAGLEVLIEQKTGYLDVLQPLVSLSACFADSKGTLPTRQVEGFLMRLGAARDLRFRSHWFDPDRKPEKQYEGAYCMEPAKTGVLSDVHVCDFARLYPNVILTYNLSPETVRGRVPQRPKPTYLAHEEHVLSEIPEGCAVVPITNVIVAQEPRGVLPLALEELLKVRALASKEKAKHAPGTAGWLEADRRDQALKVAINSYYGVIGTPYSRFYVRDVAESTACGGKAMTLLTMKAATERGILVLAGDTDSAFASGVGEEEFRAFVAWCNSELYPGYVRARGAARCTFTLEYEKTFKRLLLVGKKRYAGIVRKFKGTDGDQMLVRGLEYRRGDWPRMARHFQYEVIEMVLREEFDDPAHYLDVVQQVRDRVLPKYEIEAGRPADHSMPLAVEDVSRWQRLAKPLDEYVVRKKLDRDGGEGEDAAQGAHVTVAKVLKARGVQIGKGSKIAYVVTDGSSSPAKAIPAEDYRGELDRYYLWEQLVYPPTMRVLESAFPKEDWARFERVRPSKRHAGDPRQLKLFTA